MYIAHICGARLPAAAHAMYRSGTSRRAPRRRGSDRRRLGHRRSRGCRAVQSVRSTSRFDVANVGPPRGRVVGHGQWPFGAAAQRLRHRRSACSRVTLLEVRDARAVCRAPRARDTRARATPRELRHGSWLSSLTVSERDGVASGTSAAGGMDVAVATWHAPVVLRALPRRAWSLPHDDPLDAHRALLHPRQLARRSNVGIELDVERLRELVVPLS
jgi:hypothetical protein